MTDRALRILAERGDIDGHDRLVLARARAALNRARRVSAEKFLQKVAKRELRYARWAADNDDNVLPPPDDVFGQPLQP